MMMPTNEPTIPRPKARVRKFDYVPDRPTVITQSEGFAGFVVLMPVRDTTTRWRREYRVDLFVGRGAPWVVVAPQIGGMLIIDVSVGFPLTPDALAQVIIDDERFEPSPAGPPIVLAYP
jgi:hypothetical protein